MKIKSRSLSNSEGQDNSRMQIQQVEDKIEKFLERKFRVSRSYSTKMTYRSHIVRFGEFTRIRYNLVFINVRKIPDEKTLENTIVHELIHMRFPYISHGKRFTKLVRRGLCGKIFTPYQK